MFGILEIDPARNPAVLDTGTWDPEEAWRVVEALDESYWLKVREAGSEGRALPETAGFAPYPSSCVSLAGNIYFLAGLDDGQHVLVSAGGAEAVLGPALGHVSSADGWTSTVYKTDSAVLDRFFYLVKPDLGPRPLGPVPRLGVGCRMTTAAWPGIFSAMDACGFTANAIQNSVRELNLMEDLLAGRPPDSNYAFSFGTIESGYTGSSFEGLWLSGVLEALKHPSLVPYGADADHIQVKRGADGLARAQQIATAARYYTFFTLDVSDVLDYQAVPPQESQVGQASLMQKYGEGLSALELLTDHVTQLKGGQPFDLELSIDEHPAEIRTVDCLTSAEELSFVLSEVRRRGIPITHVAPNFGVEKGTDYRCPDGLEGLEARIRALQPVADEFGVMLDFHSGDDLSSATRRVIHRATDGRLHFKVSPMLQGLFADVLSAYDPALFGRWWNDAVAYAQREAAAGSGLAIECLEELGDVADPSPSPHHSLFHHYGFRFVGQRDVQGQFVHREEFYSLSPEFYRAYQHRVARYLCTLAEELL
jgi:hypothetical protein